jgi:hypothetical protein
MAFGLTPAQGLTLLLGFLGLEATTESYFLKTGVSEAAKKVNTALGQFNTALTEQTKTLKQTNKSLLKFDEEISHLCSDLQSWVRKCGCCGSGSGTDVNFNFGLDFQPTIQLPEGFPAAGGLARTQSATGGSGVHVEVHDYGPQQQGSGRSAGGRDLHQMVGESVAKDMKRGGPAAIAIKHAFGVARQPIQR